MDGSLVMLGGFALLIAAQLGVLFTLRQARQAPPEVPPTAKVDAASFYELKTQVTALERNLADLDGKTDLRFRRIVGTLSAERGMSEPEPSDEEAVSRQIEENMRGPQPAAAGGRPRLMKRG